MLHIDYMLKLTHFGYIVLNKLLKLIPPVSFYWYNVSTRKFKRVCEAHKYFYLTALFCIINKNK